MGILLLIYTLLIFDKDSHNQKKLSLSPIVGLIRDRDVVVGIVVADPGEVLVAVGSVRTHQEVVVGDLVDHRVVDVADHRQVHLTGRNIDLGGGGGAFGGLGGGGVRPLDAVGNPIDAGPDVAGSNRRRHRSLRASAL